MGQKRHEQHILEYENEMDEHVYLYIQQKYVGMIFMSDKVRWLHHLLLRQENTVKRL